MLQSSLQLRARAELELRRRKQQTSETETAWQPDPDNIPQCQAYETEAFETLYGGAAGGGKSDLILGLARTQHQSSLLLRREFPDLERSLIERSLQFYGDRSLYNASKHVWRIGTRRIEFGHMERVGTPTIPGDETQYASAQYDLIGIDQLEQFPQYAFEFLSSRIRTVKQGQHTRIIATANPIGEHLGWILERWAAWLDEKHPHPAKAGEIRWYKRNEDGQEVETGADDPDAVSRTFIPARLKDNKYIDDSYRKQLSLLPEPLKSALLDGNFTAAIQDDAYQVIPRLWVKQAMARWTDHQPSRAMDCVGVDVARGGDDNTVLARRFGTWYAPLERHSGIETNDGPKVAKMVEAALLEGKGGIANIDVIGIGSSAYDHAREVLNLAITPINFAEGSDARDKSGKFGFVRKRDEFWWKFREALDPDSGDSLALPPDNDLLADLVSPRYSVQTSGIKIESKEDIKKRIGRSTDFGDAVVMALPVSVMASEVIHNVEYSIEG